MCHARPDRYAADEAAVRVVSDLGTREQARRPKDALDQKYLSLISARLPFFKRKDDHLYNCRCILCGDSTKNKRKARGYFFHHKNELRYKCHNCDASLSFGNFLKQIDAVLYSQYALEKYAEESGDKDFIIVCEGPTDFYKGHPILHERAYDHWHKNLFEDKLINMDLVSPEPYRVWEYYNQQCSIAQAFDIEINGKGIRE